jgi:hypothetical protein
MLELMDKVAECEASLRAHCDSVGWAARDPGFEAKCVDWLGQKYPGNFTSVNIWKSCKALMHVLAKRTWKAEAMDLLGECTDFEELTTPGMPLLNLNIFLGTLNGIRDPPLNDWNMRAVFLEGLRYMVLNLCGTCLAFSASSFRSMEYVQPLHARVLSLFTVGPRDPTKASRGVQFKLLCLPIVARSSVVSLGLYSVHEVP